jgi:2-keto-4-pentenoate hydratase/2-oxohepta-3-ene-1,7-dioic acid hydratase in catechol pathway
MATPSDEALSGYRLLSYQASDGPSGGVLLDSETHSLAAALAPLGRGITSVPQVLEEWDEVAPVLGQFRPSGPGLKLGNTRLLAPILYLRASFCARANYSDHVAEMRVAMGLPDDGPRKGSDLPWHFVNLGLHTVVGPNAPLAIPPYTQKLDWEAEIAVVIGRTARRVPVERAMEHVAGFSILNDLSARDWVSRPGVPMRSPFAYVWVSHKCFDGSNPMGPWITPRDSVSDPGALGIRLWVNDELMQDSSSRHLIFSMAEQVAHLSSRVTLHPGDVIATGTPAGVGAARGRFLRPGDTVRIEVERLGSFSTPLVAAQ